MRHLYDSTYSFKCSVAKTRFTLVFKLHLKFLIQSTKKLSFSSIQHRRSQLQIKFSRRQITVLTRNELQRNVKSCNVKNNNYSESVSKCSKQ